LLLVKNVYKISPFFDVIKIVVFEALEKWTNVSCPWCDYTRKYHICKQS